MIGSQNEPPWVTAEVYQSRDLFDRGLPRGNPGLEPTPSQAGNGEVAKDLIIPLQCPTHPALVGQDSGKILGPEDNCMDLLGLERDKPLPTVG
jgi:hypothetical protein